MRVGDIEGRGYIEGMGGGYTWVVTVSRFLKFPILNVDCTTYCGPHQPAGPKKSVRNARWVYEGVGYLRVSYICGKRP